MYENTEFTLSRDCEAIQIPSGQKTTIPAGTQGVITQSLGGSYTVATYQGLARVAEKDLDALGLEKPQPQQTQKSAPTNGEVSEEDVWNQLRQCYDPEIPVNIVDLGLVYDCRLIKKRGRRNASGSKNDFDGARLRNGTGNRSRCSEQNSDHRRHR